MGCSGNGLYRGLKEMKNMEKRKGGGGDRGKYLLPYPAVYKGAIVRVRWDGGFDVEGPSMSVIRFIFEYQDWLSRRSRPDGKKGKLKFKIRNLLLL